MPPVLTVFTSSPRDHTASFAYRLLSPLKAMHDLGLPIKAMVDTDSNRITAQERVQAFCEADLCLLYQPVGQPPLNNVRQVQSFVPSMRDGSWKYPPTIVIESDDNLFNVSPLNPAFGNLGTRDLNGKEIPTGHQIGVVQNGERVIKWIDGHACDGTCGEGGQGDCGKGISLTANREALKTYRSIINAADAFTCSTPAVAQAMEKECTPRRVQVFPNLIRFDDYEQVDLAPKNQVTILWQGGRNHYEDWHPLRAQIGRVMRKYPQAHLVIWGALYPWVMEEIAPERYTFKAWCPYQEYKLRLAMIGHDINLAPLSPTLFNDCRSGIKFYESSVLRKPAATLAQNTAAYKAEIIDAETGLLFDNPQEFEDSLSLLIEDETARKQLAANAQDWVSENRDMMKRAPEMYAYWQMLREERLLEQPHATPTQWAEIERQFEEEQRQYEAELMARQNGKQELVHA